MVQGVKRDFEGIVARLRRIMPMVEKEEARRERYDRWFQSLLKSGLAGVGETLLKQALARRFSRAVEKDGVGPLRVHGGPTPARLKLQGKYLAATKKLSEKDKLRVQAILKRQGVVRAIKLAKRLPAAAVWVKRPPTISPERRERMRQHAKYIQALSNGKITKKDRAIAGSEYKRHGVAAALRMVKRIVRAREAAKKVTAKQEAKDERAQAAS